MRKTSPEKLTATQEEILIGSMLGDGCLFQHQNTNNPYFYISRKIQDIKYLKYEFEFFREFSNYKQVKKTKTFDKRTQKFYRQCKFVTRSAKVFESYYKQWYISGKKKLPKNLNLTPLICAIWFCDDGCVVIDKRTNRLKLKLATHCFSESENIRLTVILNTMFKEYFTIGHDKVHSYIISADSGTKEFIKYIEKHMPPLARKIVWNQKHFEQSRSLPILKNRNKLNFNNKEKLIFKILLKGDFSPKTICRKMGLKKLSNPNVAPSGLMIYLKRFFSYGWVTKVGTPHSYKNPIKYQLTKSGLTACKSIS